MHYSRSHSSLTLKKRSSWHVAGYVCIIIGIGIALFLAASWYSVKHGGVPSPSETATHSPDQPSEEPVATYKVAADQPWQITLPSIKAKAFIQRIGIDKDNQMVAPGNVNMAGWYTGSVKPGEPGLSIVDGHVHGIYAPGVFYNLIKLQPDATFSITYGDGSVRKFKVIKVQTAPVEKAATLLFARDASIKKQLNIITCGGKYIASTRSYNGRVVVMASAI